MAYRWKSIINYLLNDECKWESILRTYYENGKVILKCGNVTIEL